MRHRTAERVSRQTKALVIAISQRRNVVNLYYRGRRFTLTRSMWYWPKRTRLFRPQNYRQRVDGCSRD
jgi:DNA integrity scanning protein DisA with diadenylate cyclase activity